jgi:single-strand DNA-binding protein
MNKVILIGRLGRDPELKFTGAGQAVCTFSIATDESYKDRNGEKVKKAEWHHIVIWGKPAENAGKILKRGALVALEGKIQSREYEKDEQKRTVFEIVAHQFHALDSKAASSEQTNGASGPPRAKIPAKTSQVVEDEYPF